MYINSYSLKLPYAYYSVAKSVKGQLHVIYLREVRAVYQTELTSQVERISLKSTPTCNVGIVTWRPNEDIIGRSYNM